ncbi:thiamine phosphate synthase [Myroides fluvii]|uniref:thiamine phosphate synthase n=1 Tax=Myroides fluvii TaxID=2572594 RepID=UPI00131DFD4A|nr:thiamine phosphate synthase [Myroides fluvii]
MVVITPAYHSQELSLANEMLERGLPLLHIRKPHFTFDALQRWVQNISYQHSNRLVIHIPPSVMNNNGQVFQQYIELINSLKAQFAHLSTTNCSFVNNCPLKMPYLSTSVHNLTECEKLSTSHQRVFLSPIFSSISKKDYHPTIDWSAFLQEWNYPWIKTVALGGITPNHLPAIRSMGFTDFALLGALWQAEEPLKIFDLCYKQDLLLFP